MSRETLFHERIPVQCHSQSVSSILTCDIAYGHDELVIRLIDTNDIFKFYQCVITGSSYSFLRNEQELRVSFEEFQKKLVEFFFEVKRNISKALFNRESLKFLFIEQNEFKNIIRLELKFNIPDDNDYKKYLSEMISNLEKNNISLYKENIQLKESYKNIELDLSQRIKDISNKNTELYNKNNNLEKSLEKYILENKNLIKQTEIETNKFIETEKENSNLKYDLDKIKIEILKKDQEIKRLKEIELQKEEIETEIKTANEIIRKIREDSRRTIKEKEEKEEILNETEQEKERTQKMVDSLKKQTKEKDDRIKKQKEGLRLKDEKIRNLELEIKSLQKKIDDTKFVYTHFYKKNECENSSISERSERDSGFNIEPESPPR